MTRGQAHATGFTIVEMLVVLAIMGVLAAAARPLLELQVRRSQETALKESLRTVRRAIDAYRDAALEGRILRAVGDSGYPPNLDVLVQGVSDQRAADGRRIYFLRRLPRDPFADPTLPAAETWALRSSDSPPDEPRPGADVFDITSKAPGLALDGSRYADW